MFVKPNANPKTHTPFQMGLEDHFKTLVKFMTIFTYLHIKYVFIVYVSEYNMLTQKLG